MSNKREEKPEKPVIPNIVDYNSVLIGLLGHVDSGKTAIARMISEIVSTSGLDAHPQSKERGITIDLGFTSLILKKNLITLVDAPGHADLIRSVVASANIIDGAILVVDGGKGIQIQTAEHLVILESMGIKNIIVAINKIDLISEIKADELKESILKTFKNSIFGDKLPIVKISAKEGIGVNLLKEKIEDLVIKINKTKENKKNSVNSAEIEKDLIFPIDHHFPIKGKGIIITGTTLSGNISKGDTLTIIPQKKELKIKSLQIFHQNVDSSPNGFRVGASISGIESINITRGNIITNNPNLFQRGEIAEIRFNFIEYFKKNIHFGAQINVTFGMTTKSARIFPFKRIGTIDNNDNKDDIKSNRKNLIIQDLSIDKGINKDQVVHAFIWFLKPQFLRKREKILLSQLDMPPTSLRFFGAGSIHKIFPLETIPEVHYFKEKKGKVKNVDYQPGKVLIEGLAQSKNGADTLLNKKLEPPFEKITSTFGSKGVVIATIIKEPQKINKNENLTNKINKNDEVILKTIRKMKIQKRKSY
ncbi:MAG: GTP-binding protein [archaeon]|nr:GTP-binding protein [archaeon]